MPITSTNTVQSHLLNSQTVPVEVINSSATAASNQLQERIQADRPTSSPAATGLNQSSSGYVARSSKTFDQLVNINDYNKNYSDYKTQSKSEKTTLDNYQTKVQNGDAADNPAQFYESYANILKSNTLEEFYKQEVLFWKAEKAYTQGDPSKLTNPRAEAYKQVQDLEAQYKEAFLAGNVVEAAKIKGNLNAAKYQLQSTQTA